MRKDRLHTDGDPLARGERSTRIDSEGVSHTVGGRFTESALGCTDCEADWHALGDRSSPARRLAARIAGGLAASRSVIHIKSEPASQPRSIGRLGWCPRRTDWDTGKSAPAGAFVGNTDGDRAWTDNFQVGSATEAAANLASVPERYSLALLFAEVLGLGTPAAYALSKCVQRAVAHPFPRTRSSRGFTEWAFPFFADGNPIQQPV